MPLASRRLGYLIAVLVNLGLAYLVNVWPGWQEVPWLTAETRDVLGLVNLSLLAGAVVNLAYIAYDHPWFKALGELVTTGISLAVVVQLYSVFPFDFSAYAFDWSLVARMVLVVAILGTGIGTLASLVRFVVRAGAALLPR
ncbi:MAG: hypothetical protein WCA29_09675 [Jiangellales bacterium]